MNYEVIRLGTRSSELARWQTQYIAALLTEVHPALETETVVISTKGDRVLDAPLPLLGGKGLFTAELEAALRTGRIDLAVHSLKDLPTEDSVGLTLGAIPVREDPADVLVSRSGCTIETLPKGATIGTSSNRRAMQLLRFRPDLKIHDIRGNINTRIRKALNPDGPYDAIVLARAGVTRLKLDAVISQVLSFEAMLPAPGQAALGVQCRDEPEATATIAPIHDTATALAVTAERAFLAALGGGCSVPVAAYARTQGSSEYLLQGRVGAADGSEQITLEIRFAANSVDSAHAAGVRLAQTAIAQGADRMLRSIQ